MRDEFGEPLRSRRLTGCVAAEVRDDSRSHEGRDLRHEVGVATTKTVWVLPVGGAVRSVVGRWRCWCAVVPQHHSCLSGLCLVKWQKAPLGNDRCVSSWSSALEDWVIRRLVVLCPNASRQHVAGLVGDLVIAVVLNEEHLLGLDTWVRVARDVGDVTLIFAPVPEHLGELQDELLVNGVWICRIEN